ncbi:MAG TPA: sigma-70 family RNA polymerase sigma factor [Chthonomonadaceae bacterium]|nr:sigma-70 family RNA polymerase sigma factor [Chthonomonadaceae bacterium]
MQTTDPCTNLVSAHVDHEARPAAAASAASPRLWRDLPLAAVQPSAHRPDADCDALFAEFQPLVQRLIRQYGDEPELREDLYGEIYCRFCALVRAYDPSRGIPLRPYLVHQLAYSVYSFVRRQWRRHKREISLEVESVSRAIPTSEDVSAKWDDAMMLQKVQAGLPHAISQLSQRQRQVVIWRYYESRSFDEIAERLNIRLATARSTLRHALKNMRRRLIEEQLNYD